LVGILTVLFDVLHQISVLVPGLVVELHETHATLHQPPGE
jgi:hypothetical protein